MITLTLMSSGAEIDLSVAHIVGLSPWHDGGTTIATPTNGYVVRESRDEVRAMVKAALQPARAVDVAPVQQAARVLHALADAPDDLWPIIHRMLGGNGDPDRNSTTAALRALADRLEKPRTSSAAVEPPPVHSSGAVSPDLTEAIVKVDRLIKALLRLRFLEVGVILGLPPETTWETTEKAIHDAVDALYTAAAEPSVAVKEAAGALRNIARIVRCYTDGTRVMSAMGRALALSSQASRDDVSDALLEFADRLYLP